MAQVSIRNVVKQYDTYQAVRGVDLDIQAGEFLVLVGPSGCGKSTMLRMIAGLEDISSGELLIGGRVVNDVAPRDRDIAMVFQNYALYPHMTVYDNMAFGLQLRKLPKAEIEPRVQNAAKILDLTALLQRKPRALSGGQRQRVAMGRSIVRDAKVFLFDEPLSNLDAKLRVHMRTEIKKIHQTVRTTTIYVTHDQVEAMTLADRVVVMNHGVIEQVGTPQELYRHPVNRFVAGFIGSPAMNFLACGLQAAGDGLDLCLPDGQRLRLPAARAHRHAGAVGMALELGLRPEHLTHESEPTRGNCVPLSATVEVVEPLGSETLLHARVGDTLLTARVGADLELTPGQTVRLAANLDQMHLISVETGRVL
ncbi:sn-glycerol-3-phosphate ABC transporter ATP-binding protein UgpC [Xylophilus sp. GOD-11R]|uniref:ABC transporter ATP-binding protein n=1 Tax=Xylophilus sp. GOD-11R TaxID=3089814 RepID=UPI00298C3EC2|nr:sn-glycerol-3-phosphate ABC transporter ATP-binding protein UgpC [Xylophilus sp. GOD-11R]WPB55596.1 sn-glycerol-3-phosphate ABC transporter ATP-binding protein UgpC [Xylophilus sp. GOD-11R]